MSAHDHPTRVDGCFRCDLSSDEAEAKNATHTESVDGQGNYRAWTEHVCGTVEKPGWVSLHEYDLTRAERDAALARVDTARRDALTEAADAVPYDFPYTVQMPVGAQIADWLRRRAAVESPDRPEQQR